MIGRYLAGGLALALVVAGVQTWRIDQLKDDIIGLRAEVAAFAGYEDRAVTDAQTQADLCTARVEAARLSARRIETIIERPVHVDPQGCAVRELVPADELRDALQPRQAAAEPVH